MFMCSGVVGLKHFNALICISQSTMCHVQGCYCSLIITFPHFHTHLFWFRKLYIWELMLIFWYVPEDFQILNWDLDHNVLLVNEAHWCAETQTFGLFNNRSQMVLRMYTTSVKAAQSSSGSKTNIRWMSNSSLWSLWSLDGIWDSMWHLLIASMSLVLFDCNNSSFLFKGIAIM